MPLDSRVKQQARLHIPAARDARALPETSLLQSKRRRECRVHAAPTALRANKKRRTQANTGTPKSLRHSLRNGFTAAPRSSWCTGLFSHHRPRKYSANLTPASGARTTRLDRTRRAARLAAQRVHHTPRRESWRSRNAPPGRRGLASLNHNFCVSER